MADKPDQKPSGSSGERGENQDRLAIPLDPEEALRALLKIRPAPDDASEPVKQKPRA